MTPSAKRTERILQLNAQAETQRLEGKPVPWEMGIRRDRFWFPEVLTHLYHLPVYQQFSDQEKLVYNQTFGLMVLEQSIALEEIIAGIIQRLFRDPKVADRFSKEFGEGIDHFVREEHEHTAMFWKLAQLSDSKYEGKKTYRYFKPNWVGSLLGKALLATPRFSILWTWLTLYAEERFVMNYRETKRAGDTVCPLHAHVQFAHMLDEARHVQMDEYFIEDCWDKAPGWQRAINRWLLKFMYREAIISSTSAMGHWKSFVRDYPEMARYTAQVKRDFKQLKNSASYQQVSAGRSTLTRTYRLFDERPEFHEFSRFLPTYQVS